MKWPWSKDQRIPHPAFGEDRVIVANSIFVEEIYKFEKWMVDRGLPPDQITAYLSGVELFRRQLFYGDAGTDKFKEDPCA